MSKLAELIKELCPDGVEYKKLNEISEMKRGTSVTKKDIIEGDIPVISGGREPAYYCDTFNRDGETITVAGSGAGAGYVQYWTVPIFVCDAFSIKGKDCVKTKYLYYYLSNMQEYIYSTKKGGGVPHVHISSIDNMKIPIPPLPVQCEIVRILDNFTALTSALTSALTAELTAQRKWYSGLLNSLLSFEGRGAQDGVLWKKLGDAVGIKRGVRVVKAQLNEVGEYPVYQNSLTALGNYNYFNCNANKTFLITAGAAGEIGYSYVPFWAADDCYYFECNDSGLMERYLYYALKTRQYKLKRMVRNASVPRLGRYSIENLLIPVPSLEEQQRIVDILDRFDKLCNDLSEGLPAEIAARQKQYEYYRDKLLTFNEKKA